MASFLLRRLLALIPLTLLAALLMHYPFWPLAATLAVAAYAALLWWRPALWLLLVPAALPWLDLGTWTGWFGRSPGRMKASVFHKPNLMRARRACSSIPPAQPSTQRQ